MANHDEVLTTESDVQAIVSGGAAEALKKREAEKMSRRAVLAKVGLRFGAAAVMALSVDDLARKVTAAIATRNRDNAVAQRVANEFHNAGVAFADGPTTCDGTGVGGYCASFETDNKSCRHCVEVYYNGDYSQCKGQGGDGNSGSNTSTAYGVCNSRLPNFD